MLRLGGVRCQVVRQRRRSLSLITDPHREPSLVILIYVVVVNVYHEVVFCVSVP